MRVTEVYPDTRAVVGVSSSWKEAHRLVSRRILEGKTPDGTTFKQVLSKRAGQLTVTNPPPVPARAFIAALFAFDPASLVHGLFFPEDFGGQKIQRVLSSFVEAGNVRPVQSGGVKTDAINPSGEASKGYGMCPHYRTEYVASRITYYANIDLRQIRGFGLPIEAQRLLCLLALLKIRLTLRDGTRFRTACDLVADEPKVVSQTLTALPTIEDLEAALPASIEACASLFVTPRLTDLTFDRTADSGKVSKAGRAEAEAEADEPSDGDESGDAEDDADASDGKPKAAKKTAKPRGSKKAS